MHMPSMEEVGKTQSGAAMNLNQQLASIIFNQHNKPADVSLTKLFFEKCDEYGYEIENTAEPHKIDIVKRKNSIETSPKLKANALKTQFQKDYNLRNSSAVQAKDVWDISDDDYLSDINSFGKEQEEDKSESLLDMQDGTLDISFDLEEITRQRSSSLATIQADQLA